MKWVGTTPSGAIHVLPNFRTPAIICPRALQPCVSKWRVTGIIAMVPPALSKLAYGFSNGLRISRHPNFTRENCTVDFDFALPKPTSGEGSRFA
eukprot:CAMPEP_0178436110 /NCGR_PEP_ID=MMETSP0689_2-20121128/34272_1 /TAXON_ID=160604 /ORGANISM="Amphidinium massartii, Strain CS-259" /LENGTH=93 /DNA_ID=CAMNT_0020058199 /DNA_START=251 /DNA_END=528 /DNA_ORIENTATION=+